MRCAPRARGLALCTFMPAAATSYLTHVIPGTYDLVYSALSTATTGPRNSRARLETGVEVSASGTTVVDVDISSVEISGRLTIDGAVVADGFDYGTLSLGTDDGDSVELGTTSSGEYSTAVLPGNYDVYYKVSEPLLASVAPLNTRGKVKRGVVIPPGAPVTLDIDVVTTVISGTLEIAGMTITEETDGGRMWLRDGNGDDFPIGWTSAGEYSARVIPGTYDVYYQGTQGRNFAPRNTDARLGCFQVP